MFYDFCIIPVDSTSMALRIQRDTFDWQLIIREIKNDVLIYKLRHPRLPFTQIKKAEQDTEIACPSVLTVLKKINLYEIVFKMCCSPM